MREEGARKKSTMGVLTKHTDNVLMGNEALLRQSGNAKKGKRIMCKVGGYSPWGKIDYLTTLIEGVENVSTPSHGGIKLSRKRNAAVPEYMRREGGWYEEDCDWAIPFVVFEAELAEKGNGPSRDAIGREAHKDTLRNWRPEAYERFYGVVVTGADSFIRAEQEFGVQHAGDWVVYSACGDWKEGVPKGMVECSAGLGMRGNRLPEPTRVFLVPAEEYDQRGRFGFVIDLARHEELTEVAQ